MYFAAQILLLLVVQQARGTRHAVNAEELEESAEALASDLGVQQLTGWALYCKHGCALTRGKEGSPPSSTVIDSMDISKVKLAFIPGDMTPCRNRACPLRVCSKWFKPPRDGVEPEDLSGLLCTMSRLSDIPTDKLVAIDEKSKTGKDVLLFRGKPVKNLNDMWNLINVECPYQKESTMEYAAGALWSDTFGSGVCPSDLWKLAQSFRETTMMACISLGHQFKDEMLLLMEKEKQEQKKLKKEWESSINSLADSMAALRDDVETSIRHGPAKDKLQCPTTLSSESAKNVRKELKELRDTHAEVQSAMLKDIAVASFEALILCLTAAADASVPGISAVVSAIEGAMSKALEAAVALSKNEIAQKLKEVVDKMHEIPTLENVEIKLEEIRGKQEEEALQAVTEKLNEEFSSKSQEDLKAMYAAEAEETQKVKETLQKVKDILKEAVLTGVKAASWTAAEFIPIFGPFVHLSRAVAHLGMTVKSSGQSQAEYFTKKDPMLRSIFRMRDCMLDAFLRSQAVKMASNKAEAPAARYTALSNSLYYAITAKELNSELKTIVSKKDSLYYRLSGHESYVMNRLTTGQSKVGKIKPDKKHGDSYLPSSELPPLEWSEIAGSKIDQAYKKIVQDIDEAETK